MGEGAQIQVDALEMQVLEGDAIRELGRETESLSPIEDDLVRLVTSFVRQPH